MTRPLAYAELGQALLDRFHSDWDRVEANCKIIGETTRLKARVARRVQVHNYCDPAKYRLLIGWLSEIAPRRFLSVAEALEWLREERRRQRARKVRGHWSFNPSMLANVKDRLPVARFFAAHGQQVWEREAA